MTISTATEVLLVDCERAFLALQTPEATRNFLVLHAVPHSPMSSTLQRLALTDFMRDKIREHLI